MGTIGPGVVELYARESRDEIVRLFRGVMQPACIAHGATVLQVNSRGKSREAAFKKFAAQGAEITFLPADQFDRFLAREREQWAQAVKVSGAKLD